MNQLLGFGLVLFAGILLLTLTFWKRKTPPVFREIGAFTRLRRAAGLAVEDGTRLHVSLGRGGLLTPRGAAAFAGLSLLRQLGEKSSVSDRPPIVTSGDPVVGLLSQETLETAYEAAGAADLFQKTNARVSGLTPFSYAVGVMPVVRTEQVSANILIGDVGPEVALLTDAVERENASLVAGASEPSAQAILFASASDPLVGEEVFAATAYVGDEPSHRASLQVQDILRWTVILALLIGAGLKLVGIL